MRTGSCVGVSVFDIDISLFAQLREIGSGCRLKFLRIDLLLDLLLDIFECWYAGAPMRIDFQDDESLPGANHICVVSRLQAEGLVLKLLGQLAALEVAEESALRRRWTIRALLCHVFELAALLELVEEVVGLLLGLGNLGWIFCAGLVGVGGIVFVLSRGLGRLCSYHDLAQADLFFAFEFFLV